MSILFWNEVALEMQRRDFTPGSTGDLSHNAAIVPEQGGPTRTSRALAIVHIAMYDAVASVGANLTTYSSGHGIALPGVPSGADILGAIAGAASATLQGLWKAKPQIDYVQDRLQEARRLAEAGGVSALAFETGMHFGAAVGRAILAARDNDGHAALDDMCFSELPYRHRPDPTIRLRDGSACIGARSGRSVFSQPRQARGSTTAILPLTPIPPHWRRASMLR